jgi:hypothetical protein
VRLKRVDNEQAVGEPPERQRHSRHGHTRRQQSPAGVDFRKTRRYPSRRCRSPFAGHSGRPRGTGDRQSHLPPRRRTRRPSSSDDAPPGRIREPPDPAARAEFGPERSEPQLMPRQTAPHPREQRPGGGIPPVSPPGSARSNNPRTCQLTKPPDGAKLESCCN